MKGLEGKKKKKVGAGIEPGSDGPKHITITTKLSWQSKVKNKTGTTWLLNTREHACEESLTLLVRSMTFHLIYFNFLFSSHEIKGSTNKNHSRKWL
jgi:hypothetical protein